MLLGSLKKKFPLILRINEEKVLLKMKKTFRSQKNSRMIPQNPLRYKELLFFFSFTNLLLGNPSYSSKHTDWNRIFLSWTLADRKFVLLKHLVHFSSFLVLSKKSIGTNTKSWDSARGGIKKWGLEVHLLNVFDTNSYFRGKGELSKGVKMDENSGYCIDVSPLWRQNRFNFIDKETVLASNHIFKRYGGFT